MILPAVPRESGNSMKKPPPCEISRVDLRPAHQSDYRLEESLYIDSMKSLLTELDEWNEQEIVSKFKHYFELDEVQLGYLSLEGTIRAVGGDDDRFCHACFSGQYPTPVPNSDDETHEPVPGDPVTAIAD